MFAKADMICEGSQEKRREIRLIVTQAIQRVRIGITYFAIGKITCEIRSLRNYEDEKSYFTYPCKVETYPIYICLNTFSSSFSGHQMNNNY